jgi:hypothetical protein
MDIHIDMDAVQAAVNDTITKEVSQAAISYETKKKIGEALSNAFALGAIAEAVEKGVREADVDAIAKAVVAEVLRTATRTAVLVMQEATVDIVCKMRNIYTDADKAKVRAEILRKD